MILIISILVISLSFISFALGILILRTNKLGRYVRFFLGLYLILISFWIIFDRFKGIVYRLHYNDIELLILQVSGDGCGYRDYSDDYNINAFSGWNVRHPDYYCRMYAAEKLVKYQAYNNYKFEVLEALEKSLKDLPGTYDTGDGIIYYAECIKSIINAVDNDSSDFLNFKCN